MPVWLSIPGYFAWAEERKKAEQQLRISLSDLSHIGKEYSVPFFIENMGNWDYFFLKTPEELSLIGDTPFALDVGHAHQNHCLREFLGVLPDITIFMITLVQRRFSSCSW